MKKALVFISIFNVITIFAQLTLIPDSNFEQELINLGYDDVISGDVLTVNIENVIELDLFNKNISDLTGLRDFVSLETLEVSSNPITTLDVSNNYNLQFLYNMFNPDILNINLDNCTYLKEFLSVGSNLNTINLDFNIRLEVLWLSDNNLTSINLNNNVELHELFLDFGNSISNININNLPLIEQLQISGNPISTLNTTNNPLLKILHVNTTNLSVLEIESNILLEELGISNTNINTINLSLNTNLKTFHFDSLAMVSIDLTNKPLLNTVISQHNFNLECVQVDNVIDATNGTGIYQNWNFFNCPNYYFSENCTLGISENLIANSITLYPNPTNNYVRINNTSNEEIIKVIIYDNLGKKVTTFHSDYYFTVNNLTNGIYNVVLKTASGKTISKKISVF